MTPISALVDLVARILSETNVLSHRIYIWLIRRMEVLLVDRFIDDATPTEMYTLVYALLENLLLDCRISDLQRECILQYAQCEMRAMLCGSYDDDR